MSLQPWSIRRWLTLSFLLSVSSVSAGDPERVSIQTLLSPQATTYQRRAVTLEGVTSELQVLPPSRGGKDCPVLYGRAVFMLEDETGIMPVEVFGTCNPQAADALPHDGDHVRITGPVQVLKSEPPRQVRIQAMTIQILESAP